MLNNVSNINIKGLCFKELKQLPIFEVTPGKINKGTLLYGRNGSGKSTIAKSILHISGVKIDGIETAYFTDSATNTPITLNDNDKSKIYVFNEDFIDKNIKFKENGLSTIVMLGNKVNLSSKIDEATEKYNEALEKENNQNTLITNLNDESNDKSHKYYLKSIKNILQGKNVINKNECWAERDKIIKGNRSNTSVKDDTYKQFLNLSPQNTRDQLVIEFKNKLDFYNSVKSGSLIIEANLPDINIFDIDLSKIEKYLSKKIENPKLTQREERLFRLIQDNQIQQINYIRDTFSDNDVKFCPTCYQEVTSEYKDDLIKSVKKVLNDKVEKHIHDLENCIIKDISIDLSPFYKLKSKEDAEQEISNFIDIIHHINQKIENKKQDPYTPIFLDEFQNIDNSLNNLKNLFIKLEKEKKEYNDKVSNANNVKNELISINNQIAYYDIYNDVKKYDAALKSLEIETNTYNILRKNADIKKTELQTLMDQDKGIEIAPEIINNFLKAIFYDNERLKIEVENNSYILLSRGARVKPSQISLGERNIIALCYFFANIMNNQKKDIIYNQEYLIVIDDPISSFDTENKVGIISFLKSQVKQFLIGNDNTKVLISTHDLMTYYDLEKLFDEITNYYKENGQSKALLYLWSMTLLEIRATLDRT